VRAAGKLYQASFRGRLHHARRQSRWRERQRDKVTHHRFLKIEDGASVGGHKEVDDNAQSMAMQCAAPAADNGQAPAVGRTPVWKIPIRASARRCAWCGARATRLVRLQRWQR
jgi:hypothetical protein